VVDLQGRKFTASLATPVGLLKDSQGEHVIFLTVNFLTLHM